jgi:hypothetical protein
VYKRRVEVNQGRKSSVDDLDWIGTSVRRESAAIALIFDWTHVDTERSFMKIFTSDAFSCPTSPVGIVISIDANTCLVTSDNIPVYSEEITDAAVTILSSNV